jgi:Integrase core domain
MTSRTEITTRYAKAFKAADKRSKGLILDEVVSVTGWSRDNARRRLTSAAHRPPGPGRAVATRPRKQRANKYSYDALKVLQQVWAASGGQCGKYLVESMQLQLDALERHSELVFGRGRYSPAVRGELLAMSAATIDRYLKPVRDSDPIRGISSTTPSPLLRSSIKVRKAGDEVEDEPGFFEGDTVAHCGPTLRGEFARSLNLTDVHTGWVFTRSVPNNAHANILGMLKTAVQEIPFAVTGLDFDNGTEFLNHAVIKWAGERGIYFTRSRPYKKNDQATIESKNNHLVRKYGFYYRYDTPEEVRALNRLWRLVDDRLNFLTPTKKPVEWGSDRNGRRKRIYDRPSTPLDRLLAAGVLTEAQEGELLAYRDTLNPAAIGRQIAAVQAHLRDLAADKTDVLHTRATSVLAPPPQGRHLGPDRRGHRLTPRGHSHLRHRPPLAGILT